MTTPGDESRTELAWREIVENYGERAVLPDEKAPQPVVDRSVPDEPTDAEDTLEAEAGAAEADDVPEVERFHPPAAPPFPRPRTWQRGLAWAGIFLAPVFALVVGLFSIYVNPLFGWLLVLWFVGGFLFLVREMPRSPRDPWDDGSRI
ncbi:hypothetical protein J2X46_002798 [Nocardioides sp. BE266]|uniref:hypothetical protein n=1 Tax=Nocardioides sp. BE266 TaxID=2817725 RepID=UPI00285C7F0B|nr:hypothetical protein [Nocardioides sp. BE266]MDR7253808.1 hypothetical protein [Nocardioides sp. BE266]